MANNPIVILVGPSGAGKSTFLDEVLKDFRQFRDIITFTTRNMRQGETEGNPYHFVSRDKFESLIPQNFFVEWAEVHGNLYGTPRSQIEESWKKGESIIMDLDIQGARVFMREYPHALTIFIHPPSIDELRQRIVKRDGPNARDLKLRLENAQKEIAVAGEFSRQLVNSDFATSYAELKKMIEEMEKSS